MRLLMACTPAEDGLGRGNGTSLRPEQASRKSQERTLWMYHRPMDGSFGISLDRAGRLSLSEQIADGIRAAIREGRLAPDARLPSWNDLAIQLGVARGTVRSAYERLADGQFIVAAGAAGTRVAR